MYLGQMTCDIDMADKYRLKGLETIEIKKSVHQLVQTAKLTIPLSVVVRNNEMVESVKLTDKIKEGDKIVVDLGYRGNDKREFEGYIKRINPKQPCEFELEDELYLMRKLFLKKSFKKNDVKDLLNYLMDELYKQFNIRFKLYADIPQVTLVNFLINGDNGIEVLQELKDKYLLTTYLTTINGEKTLYCGLLYGLMKKHVKYVLNRNTISIEDLKYSVGADRTFKVEIVNHTPDGKSKKHEFGDKNGEPLKILVSGNKTEDELKHIADDLIAANKTSGYKGSFETFMFPDCEPGDIAEIADSQFPDRSGNYYIASVTTTFGVNGGVRKPEIEFRTS